MSIVFVGGRFDKDGGKQSSIANVIFSYCFDEMLRNRHALVSGNKIKVINGGSLRDLHDAFGLAVNENTKLVLWFAEVDNAESKESIDNIKKCNPKVILVASKSKIGRYYTFPDLIMKMLHRKVNLLVEFSMSMHVSGRYIASVYDPLGNVWANGIGDMPEVGRIIAKRSMFLLGMKRIQSERNHYLDKETVPIGGEFLEIVRESGARFAELLPKPSDSPIKRFVGNASFRCASGFPSFRGGNGETWVSRRNVNKEGISKKDFVPVLLRDGVVEYGISGQSEEAKPSVDAPIHCELYRLYPMINYILHGHVYLDGEKVTNSPIPCGALEEVDEIFHAMPSFNCRSFLLNLRGHGFIACVDKIEGLRGLRFIARPMPECQQI